MSKPSSNFSSGSKSTSESPNSKDLLKMLSNKFSTLQVCSNTQAPPATGAKSLLEMMHEHHRTLEGNPSFKAPSAK